LLSVIEMDLPWDDAQVEAYGNTFKAWSDDDIDVALTAIRDAMPMSKLTYVVFLFFCYSHRFITH